MKKSLLKTLAVLVLLSGYARAQDDSEKTSMVFLQSALIGTSNGQVPFWMRTNNYGSNPLDGGSGTLIGGAYKYFETDSVSWLHKKIEWAAGAESRLNVGSKIQGQLIACYAQARYRIFQVSAGRTKDKMGIADSSLSSGDFAVSGNNLGIPKIDISIPDYWTIPVLDGLISIKGNFAMGYVGTMDLNQSRSIYALNANTFYHQKSLYGRLGKENWKIHFFGGLNHQVMWGQESKYLGPYYDLSPFSTMLYAVTGKVYGNDSIPSSKIGNHIGSIDQGISYDFNSVQVKLYHQFFYDVGGLAHLNNIRDGLWGVSIINRTAFSGSGLHWKKFLVEFLYTKSQGGELTSKITPSGDENYYNNYIYYKGWSYKDQAIGNNFLTNKLYQRKELPAFAEEYYGNNRVILGHFGIEWQWNQWSVVNKISFSRNYGTYATSPIGNTTGSIRTVQPPPYFTAVSQFSGYIEASRPLKNNFNIGFVLAGDYGDLLYNSVGGMVKLTKSW